jgi:murein DD-endopeptidase MepM/ murein hydrolase activator NlpD
MFYYTVLGLLSLIVPNLYPANQIENYSCADISFGSYTQNTLTQTLTVKKYDDSKHTPVEGLQKIANMGWPVDNAIISSGYGSRKSCSSCSSYHQGLDFTPGRGENVIASMEGKVVEIGSMMEYGEFVIVEHIIGHNIWHTLYAHLEIDSVPKNVYVGKNILVGDTLGAVGSTGLTTGPHLHFEIRINGTKVNPLPILLNNIQS